jgi:hypothetical protein
LLWSCCPLAGACPNEGPVDEPPKPLPPKPDVDEDVVEPNELDEPKPPVDGAPNVEVFVDVDAFVVTVTGQLKVE